MHNISDLHTHSVLSTHAYSSVTENIASALDKGLKYYGISEHQPDNIGCGAHHFSFNNTYALPKNHNGLVILRGCEFNILEGGEIDLAGIRLERIDYGIASMHQYAYSDKHSFEENTQAYLKALEYPFIDFLGHIDRPNYECDIRKILFRCKELHKLVELNNASASFSESCIETDREIIRICKEIDLPLLLNSDAHICYDIGVVDDSFRILKEEDFPLNRVINFNEDLFHTYFKVKR